MKLMGKVGFEPTIACADRFTVCCLKPLEPLAQYTSNYTTITHYGNRTHFFAVKGQCVNQIHQASS